jgi:hypothetical protein
MLKTWNMKEEPILHMWTDKMITRYAYRKQFMVRMGKWVPAHKNWGLV